MSMQLSEQQYQRIRHALPTPRGNVRCSQLELLNALLYVVENGCKWRALPREFGPWHTIYMRIQRWYRAGVIQRVFAALQEQQIVQITVAVRALDSTSVKVHPDGTGARKKTAHRPLGARAAEAPPKFIWWPQMSERR
jgi:transposase